jgi:hypothetical protein
MQHTQQIRRISWFKFYVATLGLGIPDLYHEVKMKKKKKMKKDNNKKKKEEEKNFSYQKFVTKTCCLSDARFIFYVTWFFG